MKNIIKKLSKSSILGIIMAVVFVASYAIASIQLGSNFQLNSQLPLDARTVVADTTALYAIPAGERYEGLTVFVVTNSSNYQLQGGIANSNWEMFSGGGGVSAFTQLSDAPSSYLGQAGQALRVNAGATGLEFFTAGNALTSNPLSQFASTTSSQLAGVISDETGSGSLVFANSPVLTTPNIGDATGNINGNAGTVTNGVYTTGADTVYLTPGTAASIYQPIGSYLTSLAGALLANGATTGATSQAQVFTNGVQLSNLTAGYLPYAESSDEKLVNSPLYTDGTRVGIGTTSPATTLDVDGRISAHDLNLSQIPAAPAPSATINPVAGNLNGYYIYSVTFVTASGGETEAGLSSNLVDPVNQQINLSGIPVSSDPRVIARNIYRNKANQSIYVQGGLLVTFNDEVTTTYTDNVPDASLTGTVPVNNTTGGNIYDGSMRYGMLNTVNTSYGVGALPANGEAYYNAAFGYSALGSIINGESDVAFGDYTLGQLTTGNTDTGIGSSALFSLKTGNWNTGVGEGALASLISGSSNTGVGGGAGNYLTGNNNVAIGYGSLEYLTTDNNVGVGYRAGANIANGSTPNFTSGTSTYLGSLTKALADGDINETVIGYNAIGNGSNTVTLGNSSVTRTLLTGNVGIGTTTPTQALSINGNLNFLTGGDRIISVDDQSTTNINGNNLILQAGAGNGTGNGGNIALFAGGVSGVGPLSRVRLNTLGQGYTVGDVVTVSGGNNNATLHVDSVVDGAIVGVNPDSPGTGYNIGDIVNVAQGVIGTATLEVTSIDTNGGITGLSILYSSTGYTTATGLTLNNGSGTDGTVDITTDTGEVSGVSLVNAGTGYSNASGVATSGGTGNGLKVSTIISYPSNGGSIGLYGNIGIGTTNPTQSLDVMGGNINVDTNGDGSLWANALFSTNSPAGGIGRNIFIGGGGQNLVLGSGIVNSSDYYGYGSIDASVNTAVGYESFLADTTGSENSAFGEHSLYKNTTGTYNTAVGQAALYYNITGSNNTAVGSALIYNTTGSNNTAVGKNSLDSLNITANDGSGNNTAIGYSTGGGIVTGVNNTIIGANVGGLAPNLSNNIIIADGSGNQRINVIANGNVGIGTTSPTNILSLNGTQAQTIWMERNTTAETAGQGLTLSSGGAIAGAVTADLAGGDLNLESGISTGAGTSAIHFYTATAGVSGTTDNTPTEKMTILGNGNVGIGTTSPNELLSLGTAGTTAGELSLAGATSGKAIISVSAVAGTPILTLPTTSGTLALVGDLANDYIPYTGATSDVDLGTHNFTVDTGSLFVDSLNHQVGIGTILPTQALTINGNLNFLNGGDRNISVDHQTTTDVNGNNLTIQAGGGNGTGHGGNLVLNAGGGGSPNGDITGVNVSAGGTGYSVDDVIHVSGGNNDATLTVTSVVASGEILTVNINNPGSGYTEGDQLTVGSGDAILNVDSVDVNGYITGLSIVNGGTGYSTGTDIALSGGTGDQTATVNITASGTGVVNGVSITNAGTGYSSASGVATTGGTGDGNLTVDITISTSGNILMNGNVGIGTTSPGEKLEVNGNIALSTGADRTIYVGGPGTYALNLVGSAYAASGPGGAVNITGGQGLIGGNVVINGGLGGTGVGNVILANLRGNVGIGTTSPGDKLEVAGTITAGGTIKGNSSYGGTLWIQNINANVSPMYLSGATQVLNTATYGLYVLGDTTFGGASVAQGAVSINPTYNQSGTASATDLLINRTETAVGSGTQLLIDAQVGSVSKFNVSNTGQGYFAGNVGIGTTSPTSSLDIYGTARVHTVFGSRDVGIIITPTNNVNGIGRNINIDPVIGDDSIKFGNFGYVDFSSVYSVIGMRSLVVNSSLSITNDIGSTLSTLDFGDGWDKITGGVAHNFTLYGYSGITIVNPAGEVAAFGRNNTNLDSYFNGNVGIGNTSPDTMLTVGTASSNLGNITVYGTVGTCVLGDSVSGASCSSDERLKDNITTLGDELTNIMALRPVTFNWIDPTKNQTINMGLIAQEVQTVFPDAVHTIYGNYLGIDYASLIVPTIKAVQELNLNLEGISGLDTPLVGSPDESFVTAFFNNVETKISAWLANAGNGISNIFAKQINTNTLCVSDDTGAKTCITKAQLDALLAGAGVSASSGAGTSSTTAGNSGSTSGSGSGSGSPGDTTPPTCTPSQTLVNNVCTDSTPVIPTCTPPQTLVNNVCTDPTPDTTTTTTDTPPTTNTTSPDTSTTTSPSTTSTPDSTSSAGTTSTTTTTTPDASTTTPPSTPSTPSTSD